MKAADIKENMEKCICGECPTRGECTKGKMEGFFCARGKSGCKTTKRGCICGECPLTGEYVLDKLFLERCG